MRFYVFQLHQLFQWFGWFRAFCNLFYFVCFKIVSSCFRQFYVLWVVFVFFGCLVGVRLLEAFELCFRLFRVVSRIGSICCSCSGCLRLFLLFEIFKSRVRLFNILVWNCLGFFFKKKLLQLNFQSFIDIFFWVKLFRTMLCRWWMSYIVSHGFRLLSVFQNG